MYRATVTVKGEITSRWIDADKGKLLSDLNDDLQFSFPNSTTLMKTKDGVTTLTIVDNHWNAVAIGTVEALSDTVVGK